MSGDLPVVGERLEVVASEPDGFGVVAVVLLRENGQVIGGRLAEGGPVRPPSRVVPPEWFVTEVAAARAELAAVAPQVLALADRYVALRERFNEEIVPRAERLLSNDWEVPWEDSGAQEFSDSFDDLVLRAAEALELDVR